MKYCYITRHTRQIILIIVTISVLTNPFYGGIKLLRKLPDPGLIHLIYTLFFLEEEEVHPSCED